MKIIFTVLFVLFFTVAFSQPRRVKLTTFLKDSINLHMDENYALIEDTCSKIVRYGHYRIKDHKFYGAFRDLNKYDPSIVLAEGKYTDDGELDGSFTMNYLNGDPLAAGKYDRGKMTGRWLVYYPGNKRRIEFENNADETKVLNAWDASGKQQVTDGSGLYKSDLGILYWEGKLLNGKPEGIWRCKKTADRTGTVVSSETFKNGAFIRGSGPTGNYTDASRVILAGENLLPINNAPLMIVSSRACDPSMSRKNIVPAVYKEGIHYFNEEIKRVIIPVFQKVDLKYYGYKTFDIKGFIDEKGAFTDFKYIDGWEDRMASNLLFALYKLPYMEPALVDGKPVKTDITFKFKIEKGLYTFSWKIDPVKLN